MSKKQIEETPAIATVTQETLDETPVRMIKFLRAVGTVPAIRAALAARGYTPEEHAHGWTLLHTASGYVHDDPELGVITDHGVSQAIATLDAWDEDGIRTVRAALIRHPKQAAIVLAGIAPTHGAAAVVGVKTLLDRLDALEKSKAAADHAALKTIADRGVTSDERKRLRALIATAEKGTAMKPAPVADDGAAAEHHTALVALRAWFEEWSEIARVAIKRHDRLIRLGLAKRKSPKKPAPPPAAGATNGSSTAPPAE